MAAGNGGRPSYRRRRARNVDLNHHQVHAGCSRVEAGRGGEGKEGWPGSLLPRRCGGLRGERASAERGSSRQRKVRAVAIEPRVLIGWLASLLSGVATFSF